MDSNFRVNITTDISELQAGLKRVQVELEKFKKSADGAAAATKNMEANANRGRMTAFAFGQVIRDAGFFANSFSLGILAISNNIPILIDQLTLSVKALQPFAGYITIASSVLTAALTIWAYSAQAVEKNTDSLEDYTKALDATNRAQLKGVESSANELTTLRLLYEQTQNTTLSLKARRSAVDQLQELYPKYFANLSDEAILAGQGAKNYTELTNSIIASAKARGGADIIAENTKEEYLLQKRITDAKAAQAELDAQRNDQQQIYQKGTVKETEEASKSLQSRKLNNILNAAAIADIGKIGVMQLRLNQLKGDDLKIQELINKEIEKGGSLTEDFGKDIEGPGSYQKALEKLSDSIKKINENTGLSFSDKNKSLISAYTTAIESLSLVNTKQAADKIDELKNSLFGLKKELFAIEGKEFAAKLFSSRIKQDAEDSIKELDNLNAEIQKGLDTDELQKKNDRVAESFANMSEQVRMILQEGLINTISESFIGMGEAIVNGTNVAAGAIGGLLNAASGMFAQFGQGLIKTAIETAILTTGIGKAIEGIKAALTSLKGPLAIAAGVALLALAGAARAGARSIAGGGSASGGGAASSTPLGSSFGGMRGITAFPNSTNNGQIGNVIAETKISGNDLSILIKRADNNRNEYF